MFGTYDNKYCRNCEKAKQLEGTGDFICKNKGVVDGSFTCKKFVLDPFKLKKRKVRSIDVSVFSEDDFSIE